MVDIDTQGQIQDILKESVNDLSEGLYITELLIPNDNLFCLLRIHDVIMEGSWSSITRTILNSRGLNVPF